MIWQKKQSKAYITSLPSAYYLFSFLPSHFVLTMCYSLVKNCTSATQYALVTVCFQHVCKRLFMYGRPDCFRLCSAHLDMSAYSCLSNAHTPFQRGVQVRGVHSVDRSLAEGTPPVSRPPRADASLRCCTPYSRLYFLGKLLTKSTQHKASVACQQGSLRRWAILVSPKFALLCYLRHYIAAHPWHKATHSASVSGERARSTQYAKNVSNKCWASGRGQSRRN